jgi:hypothetical protein
MRGAADYTFSRYDGTAYKRVADHQTNMKIKEVLDEHDILHKINTFGY